MRADRAAMKALREGRLDDLAHKVERCGFTCEAENLEFCQDWLMLRALLRAGKKEEREE